MYEMLAGKVDEKTSFRVSDPDEGECEASEGNALDLEQDQKDRLLDGKYHFDFPKSTRPCELSFQMFQKHARAALGDALFDTRSTEQWESEFALLRD